MIGPNHRQAISMGPKSTLRTDVPYGMPNRGLTNFFKIEA